MAAQVIKWVFKGFTPAPDFVKFANERLVSLAQTAPFGATCLAEIERLPNGTFKAHIKLVRGSEDFSGISNDTDMERTMQRCMGLVRGKTFKWRKEKLARKNKPHEATPEELADPFYKLKKKFFTG